MVFGVYPYCNVFLATAKDYLSVRWNEAFNYQWTPDLWEKVETLRT